MILRQHGLSVTLPPGWDGGIYRRPARPGETTHAVLHASTCALPPDRGDFGSQVVESLGPDDLFVALLEYHPDSASTSLFAPTGPPPELGARDFSPNALQRRLAGQAGAQRFFSFGGRAFCLYVVLGSFARRTTLAVLANAVIRTVQIESGAP